MGERLLFEAAAEVVGLQGTDGPPPPALACISAPSASSVLTLHGIELTNLYVCLILWTVGGFHYSVFRRTSALALVACLGAPPFAYALINLVYADAAMTTAERSHPYLVTWVRAQHFLLIFLSQIKRINQ